MRDAGALLVRRRRPWAEGMNKRPRNAALPLSEDELARAYRGIDGVAWPEELSPDMRDLRIDDGLAPIDDFRRLVALAAGGAEVAIYDAVIVARSGVMPTVAGVEFLGFDVGYYSDEYSCFSSILNEALHSPVAELRRFAPSLNDSLLFATRAEVEQYTSQRAMLRASGRDVEDDEVVALTIYGLRRS